MKLRYPMPEKYATVTTERCWHSWRYVVPLGPSLYLRTELGKAMAVGSEIKGIPASRRRQ